jgi:hypothetical protein
MAEAKAVIPGSRKGAVFSGRGVMFTIAGDRALTAVDLAVVAGNIEISFAPSVRRGFLNFQYINNFKKYKTENPPPNSK